MTAGPSSRLDAIAKIKAAAGEFLVSDVGPTRRASPIDKHAKNVIKRITEDGFAAEAIVFVVPSECWADLFADCIIAEREARMHADFVHDAQASIERAEKARQALDQVAQFLGHRRSTDKLIIAETDFCRSDPEQDAVHLLGNAISSRQRLADAILDRSSRKTTPDAGRARGIAWIKDALSAYGMDAKSQEVAAVATAALGMGVVTSEAARKSLGVRRHVRGG